MSGEDDSPGQNKCGRMEWKPDPSTECNVCGEVGGERELAAEGGRGSFNVRNSRGEGLESDLQLHPFSHSSSHASDDWNPF